jgi:hypothetical protein
MINLMIAVNRLRLLARLALAIAGFLICLSGTVVDLTFGDATLVVVIAWVLRVVGFVLSALFFATMLRSTSVPSKRKPSLGHEEFIDLEHSSRLDNWNHRDYWGHPHKDQD